MAAEESNNKEFSVSVVIPAFNAGRHVGRAIESVLGQTLSADEVIVVDDGSSDDTAEVVGRYGSKVRLIRQDNAGASAARNAGIKAAGCEWVAFLDCDDEWLPKHLETGGQLLGRNPDLVWSTGNFYRCLCGEGVRNSDVSEEKAKQFLRGNDYFDDYFEAYLKGFGGWTGTMIIKRSALVEAGLFRVEQRQANDLDMWWRVGYRWPKIGYAAQAGAIYHMGVGDTISQGYFHADLYCELIGRHLELSAEAGRGEEFEHFAGILVCRWMRSMLFDARGADIRRIMVEFGGLVPNYYKVLMRILTIFPRITSLGCRVISFIVRLFKLRRKVTRRPRRF